MFIVSYIDKKDILKYKDLINWAILLVFLNMNIYLKIK